MRFVKIEVESFKAIRHAELEFGPGVNVLYGPNDIGKSTIATAIQAALLVPPGTSEAGSFQPWHADAVPRVALTFLDDTGRYWRVNKSFGNESTAELRQSKDGLSFTLEAKQRQVEEKLRTLLGWGIATPGGKSGPRGLPSSFLTNVLLAPQTDVESILEKSLAEDGVDSGKLRLNKALATLAQDPLLKKVLEAAQVEVNRHFTPKGLRKRSAQSPFFLASQAVKKRQEELDDLRQKLTRSRAVEAAIIAQHEKRGRSATDVEEAEKRLGRVKAAFARDAERRAAQGEFERVQTALDAIDTQAAKLKQLETLSRTALELAGDSLEQRKRAAANLDEERSKQREAEEKLRAARSAGAEQERELQRVQLEKALAENKFRRQELESQRARVSAALAAAADAKAASNESDTAAGALERARAATRAARDAVERAEGESALARAVLAYGRWRVSELRSAEAEKLARLAEKDRKGALALEASVAEGEAAVSAQEVRLAAKLLPSEGEVRKLVLAERDLKLAEAALGGGLSIAVRSRGEVIRASVDGGAGVEVEAQGLLEAQRIVKLEIGKSVDVEIIAGAPEKRRTFEALHAIWASMHGPFLAQAGFATVEELEKAVQAAAGVRRLIEAEQLRLQSLRIEVTSARSAATRNEEQAKALAVDSDELKRLRALVGDADEAPLAESFERFGRNWEGQAESQESARARMVNTKKEVLSGAKRAEELADYKDADAAKQAQQQLAKSLADAAEAGGGDLIARTSELAEAVSRLGDEEEKQVRALAALSGAVTDELARLEAALKTAADAASSANTRLERTSTELRVAEEKARDSELQAAGERRLLESMNRPATEAQVDVRKRELAALADAVPTGQSDVDDVERVLAGALQQLEQDKHELHTLEGALSQVGGASVREEVVLLEEALTVAQQNEREIEIDADAWKLLHDTVREVENAEGAHLGRALARPLTARFVEVTGGRYEQVRLDGGLKTEGLGVVGVQMDDDNIVDALSAGTRDQLATLIRLTIAEQLKTAIVLDDQLVHTDRSRLDWFRRAFLKVSLEAQVMILTCRPRDYLAESELQGDEPMRDVAGGTIRAIDALRLLTGWGGPPVTTVTSGTEMAIFR